MCLNTPFGPGAAKNGQSGHRQERKVDKSLVAMSNTKYSTPPLTHAQKNLEHMVKLLSSS